METKSMAISDELLAIQTGKLKCSPENLAVRVTYCRKHLEVIQKALDSQATPPEYRKKAEVSANRFAGFIRWAEAKNSTTMQGR